MKTKIRPLLIALLIASIWMIPDQTQALLFIPGDSRSGIMITETATDDPNDTDQGFQTSDRDVIVKIDNERRRWLVVVIDRRINGGGMISVDNGPNDVFLGLGKKIVSAESLPAWADCYNLGADNPQCSFTAPTSRRYFLPVPSDAAPGSEIKFRVRIVGPALLSTSFPDGDIDTMLKVEAYAQTLWEIVIADTVKMYLGLSSIDDPENKSDTLAIIRELINHLKIDPGIIHALEQKDYMGAFLGCFNFLAKSEQLKAWAERKGLGGSKDIAELVNVHLSAILRSITVVEMMNALAQLASVKWQETFEVVVVIPRIAKIEPAVGKAGDHVIISGVGFDPYKIDNNSVFFTGLNPQGVPWLKLKANVVEVSAEDTMKVEVPADFVSGPVMVCTGSYCSNTDVVFGNPQPTGLSIIAPSNNAKVSGSISVVAVVPSPPDPFPASVGRLLVDGTVKAEKAVTTPDFSFVLDTGTLTAAVHTLMVELITAGKTISASVQVDVGPPSATLSITSPAAGSTVSGTVTLSAAVQNPPSPFPQSQARLLVDGSQRDSKSVSTPSFSLSVDALTIGAGPHTFTVEIDLAGGTLTASVQATVRTEWYPEGYNVLTTKMRCYPVTQYTNPNSMALYPFTDYIIKAHPASSGKGVDLFFYHASWFTFRIDGQIGQPVIYKYNSNPNNPVWFMLYPRPFVQWYPGTWPESTCNKVEIAYPPGGRAPVQNNPQWCNP